MQLDKVKHLLVEQRKNLYQRGIDKDAYDKNSPIHQLSQIDCLLLGDHASAWGENEADIIGEHLIGPQDMLRLAQAANLNPGHTISSPIAWEVWEDLIRCSPTKIASKPALRSSRAWADVVIPLSLTVVQ
ncbi:hypothetical protein DSECCO2_479670 [anaerobic digester metagenome]